MSDSGAGSLRHAITYANQHPGRDAIYFVEREVGLITPLPEITGPVVLGAPRNPTDPDADDPYVRIMAYGEAVKGDGLRLSGGDSLVQSLSLEGFRHGIVIAGPGGNVIGGERAPVRIRNVTGDGIRVLSGEGNRIGPNVGVVGAGGLPIDLGGDGRTANDPGDADAGANGLQNAPRLTGAVRDGGNVIVGGVLDTAPGVYRVDVYAAPVSATGALGETQYLGTTTATVGGDGAGAFSASVGGSNLTDFWRVTAVATAADGSTSEYGDGVAVTYPVMTVTTAADAGPGSLRQAILDAKDGPSIVRFAIPGAGVHRVTLTSALPVMSRATQIDGTTQPGYAGAPVIELVGQTNFLGLVFGGGTGSYVRGLAIGGFEVGVRLESGGASVRDCYVGLDAAGRPLGNLTGIFDNSLDTLRNVIEGNVVSGNVGTGIRALSLGTTVIGNRVGTNPAGTAAVPNDVGMDVGGRGEFTIGGTLPAARNLVSGNTRVGLRLDVGSGSAVVQGNYFGTDWTGERGIPNDVGVEVTDHEYGTIGGSVAGARNVISGNRGVGLRMTDFWGRPGVAGNYVGLSASGKPLGNGGSGIVVSGFVGVGGTNAADANVVAHNGGAGVEVLDGVQLGLRTAVIVRGNAIYSNGGLAIDLHADGPTPNDPGDEDAGANELLNTPVLTAAYARAGETTVVGRLDTKLGRPIVIDFYAGGAPGGGGGAWAEARTYLGSVEVPTDRDGYVTFSATFPASIAGQYVTATATDPKRVATRSPGGTSEFSAARRVGDRPPPVVASSGLEFTGGRQRLAFGFSADVGASLDAADLRVEAQTPGVAAPAVHAVAFDRETGTAWFSFAAPLPDGDYRATLAGEGVTDDAGNALAADATLDFWHLAGDANRDRQVDFADLTRLAQNYDGTGKAYADGDFTGDGTVDFSDLVVLAQRYDTGLGGPPEWAAGGGAFGAARAVAASPVTVTPTSQVRPVSKKAAGVFSVEPVAKPKAVARPRRR
jgi:hypothetical protein